MARKQPSYILLAFTLILLALGIAFLADVSSVIGQLAHNDVYYHLKRQFLLGVIPGLALFIFFYIWDYRKLKKVALIFLIINFICSLPMLRLIVGLI
jgi:cell division protein FtsW (lipid II flippase)